MIEKGDMFKDVTLQNITSEEKERLEKYRQQKIARVRSEWTDMLETNSRWQKPHIVNGDAAPRDGDDLKVYACFLPAGAHEFIIRSKDSLGNTTWSIHRTMVDIRTEEIPLSKLFKRLHDYLQ